jgi:hypothetical protein
MHGMLHNGRDANERLVRLRNLLRRTDSAQWEAFVDRIRPAAMRYGLNFGLLELQNAGGPSSPPMSAEDRAIRDTFLRSWDKGTAQQQKQQQQQQKQKQQQQQQQQKQQQQQQQAAEAAAEAEVCSSRSLQQQQQQQQQQ